MATKLDLYNKITGGTDNDMFKSITGKDRSTVNKEYNLSPVKTSGYLKQKKPKTTKSKSILSGYLKTGALSDGYDFGDLTKTVFGTLSSIEQNAARGVSKATEGILDTGLWGVGKVAEKLGQQKIADATKKIIAKDITGEGKQVENIMGLSSINQAINDILNGGVPYKRNVENIFAPTKQAMRTNAQDFTVEEAIDDFLKNYQTEEDKKTKANTILGEKAEGLVQSGAQMLGTQALQATTGIPWWVTTGLSSFGNQTEEAFNEGASYNQAGMSALVSALGEVLTEKISGGISYGGKTLDKGLKSQLTKGISNKVLNTLAQYGIDVLGEGAEEVLSNIITRLGKKLTYEKDKTWKELLTSEEAVDSYIQDFIGGAVMGGIGNVSQAVSSIKTGRNYETGLTQAEQKVVDTEVENRIGDKKVSAKEKTKIEDQVKRDLEKGYISQDTISKALNEDYKQIEDYETKQKRLEELLDKKVGETTNRENSEIKALQEELDKIDINTLRNQINQNTATKIGNNSILQATYNENANKSQKYTNDLSKYNKKEQKIIQKAIDSGVLNNTNKTHDFIDMIAKISSDKNVDFDFTNNENLKNSGFAIDGATINGYVDGNKVTLNIDSKTALNSVVGHEITHVLENTELYDKLQESVENYAKTKGVNIDSRLEELKKLYSNVKGVNVRNELTSDLVGEYLFTDKDFVNRLSTEQPNLFKKILDEIKYLVKVATAGSKEKKELLKAQKMFEEAYRTKASPEALNKEAVEKQTTEPNVNTQEIVNKAENTVKSLQKTTKEIEKATDKQDEIIKKQDEKLDKVVEKIDKLEKSIEPLEESVAEFTDGLKEVTDENLIEGKQYSLSNDEVQTKINQSMSMNEAKKMIDIAFKENQINDWREENEKYRNADEWLNDVGIDEVAMYIENGFSTIENYLNPLYERDNSYGEDYVIEDILEAYKNGTLTGYAKQQANRLDLTKESNIKDNRFYSPQTINDINKVYDVANQRVTNSNKEEVYKARGDFVILAHNQANVDELGLSSKELNQTLKKWAAYPNKALELSNKLNENVAYNNKWSGLENSSILYNNSISNEELSNMVKSIEGDSSGWQRNYITSTMLALDTHIDYKKLSFEFDKTAELNQKSALGDYNRETKTIRIGRGYQNTVAHEMGHYLDNTWAEDFGFVGNMNMTNNLNFEAANVTDDVKQFAKNFKNFMDDLVKSATTDSTSKISYYQDRSEVFARFVGRFVEWTKNTASGNRFGYEDKYYKENFTQSQYEEFVKLLQEKSMLDTTGQTYNKINEQYSLSNENQDLQQRGNYNITGEDIRLQESIEMPIEEQPIEITQGIAPLPTQPINELAPIMEKSKKKEVNPLTIAQLTPEDANTTPKLPKATKTKGEGRSRVLNNITETSQILNEEQKAIVRSAEYIKYYDSVTNEKALDRAYKKLQDGGKNETLSWMSKDSKNADSTDVAEGWILMKQYADNNDIDGLIATAKKMKEIGTTAGQTVQAFNIMERLTPEGMVAYAQSELSDAYNEMVKNKSKEWIDKNRSKFDLTTDEVTFIMDNMKEVSQMEDGYDKQVKLAEIQKIMTDKLPPEKGQKIKSWMRLSMLFNPKTQVRNVVGNAIIAPVNYFGDMFASAADYLVAKKTGVRTTGTMNVESILKGFKDGAIQATNDYRKGINTRDMEGNRFEIGVGKSFSNDNLIGKGLNLTEDLLNYVMDAGDRVFSQSSFENSLQNQMRLNNVTKPTQEMIDIARKEALSRTWNDNNNYTNLVLNIRKNLNRIGFKNYGLGDVLIPFAKTPANLTKAIVDYSPVGFVNTLIKGNQLRKAVETGQFTPQMQHEFAQSLGKATAGSALYILGMALASAGVISGESDEDKDTANFLKNTLGINSYSIKLGGKTFTYDWAQPVAAPLAITANLKGRKNQEQALLEGIIGSLDTASSVLLEQSFLTGIREVLDDNDGIVSGMANETLKLPSRAIPTFSKQIADLVDGTQRQTYVKGDPKQTAINAALVKIPGASKTLAPTVDTMGRDVQKYGGKNNIFNVFLNPANVSTENISESAKEIYDVYKATGDKTIMPRVAPYSITTKDKSIELTPQQRTDFQRVSGKIIEDNVALLTSDSQYNNLSDSEKAEVLNNITNYAYNKAREKVLDIPMAQTYNKVNEYVSKGGNVADYYLDKKEINYSLQNEDKYKTLSTFMSYDDYTNYAKQISSIKDTYSSENGYKSADRKQQVVNYIEELDLTIPQKVMLLKEAGGYGIGDYKNYMYNYINNLDLTKAEKEEIYYQLYPKR